MFRNLTFFRFPEATGADIFARLPGAVLEIPLIELEPNQMDIAGFCEVPGTGEIVVWIGMVLYLCIAMRERVISPKSVAEILEKQLKQREEQEGRKVGGRERKRMREQIFFDLMPHAPIVTRRTLCLIDPSQNWIALDTASPRVAEACVSFIHFALGSFPALPLHPEESPCAMLTAFLEDPNPLAGPYARSFHAVQWRLGNECKLQGDDESIVSYADQELTSNEIERNLHDGKRVRQLGVIIREQISATITTDLVFKRLKFLDGAGFDEIEDQAQELAVQALQIGMLANDVFSLFQCETPE